MARCNSNGPDLCSCRSITWRAVANPGPSRARFLNQLRPVAQRPKLTNASGLLTQLVDCRCIGAVLVIPLGEGAGVEIVVAQRSSAGIQRRRALCHAAGQAGSATGSLRRCPGLPGASAIHRWRAVPGGPQHRVSAGVTERSRAIRGKSPLFISRSSRISRWCWSQSPNRLMAFSTMG